MQRYRNLRRTTEPCKSKSRTKQKQTASFVAPLATSSSTAGQIEEGDQLVYDDTHSSLLESYAANPPDIQYVKQLMKLTFTKRRKLINDSIKSTLTLKAEHPYFGFKLWVCYTLKFALLNICNMQVQAEFELICGADSIEKIAKNWITYLPKILSNEKEGSEFTEQDHLQAIKIVHTALKPPGGAAKSPAAFDTYKVKHANGGI